MKITNTREFSESLADEDPLTIQFPNNTNVILTEQDVNADWLGQVEEMAKFSGRSVHLRQYGASGTKAIGANF